MENYPPWFHRDRHAQHRADGWQDRGRVVVCAEGDDAVLDVLALECDSRMDLDRSCRRYRLAVGFVTKLRHSVLGLSRAARRRNLWLPNRRPARMFTRGRAFEALDTVLDRLAVVLREPTAWEEFNLLEAIVAITSGHYQTAIDRIADAQRAPTLAEISALKRRPIETRTEIRARVEELKDARMPTHISSFSLANHSGGATSTV
jgi:hypothetical protein